MSGRNEAVIAACAKLIQYTGAESFRIGYSHEDDGKPIVWYAVASFKGNRHEADASLVPHEAMWRLCERLVDGGRCVHCDRPTALVEDETDLLAGAPQSFLCQYRYRAGKIRRGCDSMPVGTRS